MFIRLNLRNGGKHVIKMFAYQNGYGQAYKFKFLGEKTVLICLSSC